MASLDVQMSEIIVVIDEEAAHRLDELVVQIKGLGVEVENVDHDNGVVEAITPSSNLPAIEKLTYVKFVRRVFNYIDEAPGQDEAADEAIPR